MPCGNLEDNQAAAEIGDAGFTFNKEWRHATQMRELGRGGTALANLAKLSTPPPERLRVLRAVMSLAAPVLAALLGLSLLALVQAEPPSAPPAERSDRKMEQSTPGEPRAPETGSSPSSDRRSFASRLT